jgi:Na+-driven multidrug efflux pump
MGISGAALTTSLSYMFCMCYLLIIFIRKTGIGFIDFKISKSDFYLLLTALEQNNSNEDD